MKYSFAMKDEMKTPAEAGAVTAWAESFTVELCEFAGKRPIDEPRFVAEVVRSASFAQALARHLQNLSHHLVAGRRFVA